MAILGRADHLSVCRRVCDRDRRAAAAVIVGAPGIGKTSLLRAVVAAVPDGVRVLATSCLRGTAAVPLGSLADLLDPAAVEVLDQLPDAQAAALRSALRMTVSGTPVDDFLLARATANALRALGADRRVVVVVDDAQWVDRDTDRLLHLVAAWLHDVPIGWLIAVRPGHETGGIAGTVLHELAADAVTVALPPLDDVSLCRLVAERFPGRWSTALIDQIVALSGGNPYTALELARETIASGSRDAPTARVPRTLADSLGARLRRLSPTTMDVVRFAALSRRPTQRLLRSALDPLAEDTVDDAVDEAVELEILECRDSDDVLTFTHPLLAEMTVRSWSWSQRQRAHRALARAVADPDEAARHLAAGTDEPNEDTAALVTEAAQRLRNRGMLAGAAALAEAALRLTPDGAGLPLWRRRLLTLDVLEHAQQYEKALTLVSRWQREDPPDEEQIRGRLTMFRGHCEPDQMAARQVLAQAVDQLEGDLALQAHVCAVLANRYLDDWRLDLANSLAERAIGYAQRSGRPEVHRFALATKARVAVETPQPGAGDLLRAAVAMPGWDRMWFPAFSPEAELGVWHLRRGELHPARLLLEKVHRATDESGHVGLLAAVTAATMLLEYVAGRWEQADEYGRSLLRHFRHASPENALERAIARSLVPAGRGQTTEVRAAVTEALAAPRTHDWPRGRLALLAIAVQLELSVDDPAAAFGWLEPVAEQTRCRAFADMFTIGLECDLIESYARVGRTAEAAERLHWLHAAAISVDNPLAQVAVSRCAAILALARGDVSQAHAELEPALPAARRLEAPLDLGRFLLTLGTARRRARLRQPATTLIDEAIDTFDTLGARNWVALARAERAKLVHAADGLLTPTEQRITDLVRLGHTNAEIAASLLLREKTIEANLTRIYRKLGIRGRVNLARTAAANECQPG